MPRLNMKTDKTQKQFEHDLFPQIELDSFYQGGNRYYKTPDGRLYPSVTSVLSFFKDGAIDEWKARVGEEQARRISKYATDRGTALHTMCENYLENIDYKAGMMPTTLQLFKGIQPIIDQDVQVIHGIEIPLFSHKLKTAGRCDLFCKFRGQYTIADFKTSTRLKKPEWIENYFLQTTAYAMMIEEMYREYETDIHIPQLAIIIAVEEDEMPSQLFVRQTSDYRDKVEEMFANYHAQHQPLTLEEIQG